MPDHDSFDFTDQAVADIRSAKNQTEAAKVYAKAIRMMGTDRPFVRINAAVRERWPSKSGLLRVKELAWKELDDA